jgi:integrase
MSTATKDSPDGWGKWGGDSPCLNSTAVASGAMPRPLAPPRLYWRKARADRAGHWSILFGGTEYPTGAAKHEMGKAEAALAQFILDRAKPSFGKGHPDEVAIATVLTEYGDKHGPETRRPDLIGMAIGKLADFWGDRPVSAITSGTCTDYVRWRCNQTDPRFTKTRGRRIKPGTARRELEVLKAAIGFCWEVGRLDRPIPVKLPKASEPREHHLSRSEAASLLRGALGWDQRGVRHRNRINRHVARFILLGLYTGTRHSAMLKLQWRPNSEGGYVDLNDKVIYRRPRDATDSKKRRTPVPISPRLLPHLKRWRKLTLTHVIEWHGRPIISKERYGFDAARKLADLDAGVTPHVLRHTCATWLLQAGVSIFDTAGVLGCNEAVVRTVYGHYAKGGLEQAVAAFVRPCPAHETHRKQENESRR